MPNLIIISNYFVLSHHVYHSENILLALIIILLKKSLIIYNISQYNIQYKSNNYQLVPNKLTFKI